MWRRERGGEGENKRERGKRGWLRHGITDMKGIQVSKDDGTAGELLEMYVCFESETSICKCVKK